MTRAFCTAVLLLLATGCASPGPADADQQTGQVIAGMPKEIRPDRSYLFYLHGRIIEDAGPRPTHPRFGIYEYAGILDALAAAGFTVISEQRGPGTNVSEYAGRIAGQVKALLDAGVAPESVTVVGFSKGGVIAIEVSSLLRNERVNFVFLASCGRWGVRPDIRVSGRILSVVETSDRVAGESCDLLYGHAGEVSGRREVTISTGEGHGAFYRPRAEWMQPLVAWASGATR